MNTSEKIWPRVLSHSASRDYGSAEECQRLLQEGHPTFVPTFLQLRNTCLQRTSARLQELEHRIRDITQDPSPDRDALVDEARTVLHDLDRQFETIVDKHQLEDPDYAAARGLSVVHFTIDRGAQRGDWMLLSSNWGPRSTSITESAPSKLTSLQDTWLKQFNGGTLPPVVATKRRRTLLERQPRAVRELPGSQVLVPDKAIKRLWMVLIGLAFFCLFLFLAVGIIATTTTFSPIFVKTFFWIAIIWTMASSSLLVAIVRAFGGDGKDCLTAFLAAVAIWLVVIQIGQTHLGFQDPSGNGTALSLPLNTTTG